MTEFRLFLIQRASAAVLAVMVAVHLAVIGYAMHQGLSAASILGRTRTSMAWPVFYALFTLAAASHGVLGLRAILREHLGWRGICSNAALAALWVALVALGLRAVVRIA